jgi:hypothetical protein
MKATKNPPNKVADATDTAPDAPPAAVPACSESVRLAVVALEQRQRLLVDVEQRRAKAGELCDKAHASLGVSELALDKAMAASSAAREDERLALAAARADVFLEHVKKDYEKARAELEALDAEHLTIAQGVGEARTLLAREQHRDLIFGDRVFQDARDTANKLVGSVVAVIDALQTMRASLLRHNALVEHFRGFGGEPELRPLDGTMVAGEIMRLLHAAGGGLGGSVYTHKLRWAVDLPSGLSDPIANIHEAARRTIAYVLDSLDWAARDRAKGVPTHGREQLADLAEVFAKSRERNEAEERLAAMHRSRGEAREGAARAAHEQRLATVESQEEIERRSRGRGHRADGSVIEPPPDSPDPLGIPEITVG